MDQTGIAHCDPFLAALRELPGTHLLSTSFAEALLHLPSQALDGLQANQEPVPPRMTVGGQVGYLAGDLVQYAEQSPTRRGPIKTRHPSFSDFLTHGQPDEVWAFGMVALDFHGMRRPVDLLTCLELPAALPAHVHYQHMTLKEYVETMDRYLFQFQDQQQAEVLATERALLADSVAPGKLAGRVLPSRDRS